MNIVRSRQLSALACLIVLVSVAVVQAAPNTDIRQTGQLAAVAVTQSEAARAAEADNRPLAGSPESQPTADPAADNATGAVAFLVGQHGGEPTDYYQESNATYHVPWSEETLWTGTFRDKRTGDDYIVYRNEVGSFGGNELRAERDASAAAGHTAFELKSDPALRQAAADAGSSDLLPVGIWLRADTTSATSKVVARHPEVKWDGDRPEGTSLEQMRELMGDVYRAKQAEFVDAEDAFGTIVTDNGGKVEYLSTSVPLVFALVPTRSLEKLANRDEVVNLGLNGVGWDVSMDVAGPTVNAKWSGFGNDQGTGVRVGSHRILQCAERRRIGGHCCCVTQYDGDDPI